MTIYEAWADRLVRSPAGLYVGPNLNREQWIGVRTVHLGSTDSAAILGQDEYKHAAAIWDRIVFERWEEGGEGGDIRRGLKQEAVARETFTERTGLPAEQLSMIRHPHLARVVSDLDGVIPRPTAWPEQIRNSDVWSQIIEHEGPGALELKAPRIAEFYRLKSEGLPRRYIIQMQHHLGVSGCTWGFFAFYCAEYDDMVAFPVVRDDEFCGWLFDTLGRWWQTYVVGQRRPERPEPPPPSWPAKVLGEAIQRDDEAWGDIAMRLSIRYHELVEAQGAYDQTEAELLALVAEEDGKCAECGKADGQAVLEPKPWWRECGHCGTRYALRSHLAGGGVTLKRTSTRQQRRTDHAKFAAALRLAQKNGDDELLMSLDPSDDTWKYTTTAREKVEVAVFGPNPMEIMQHGPD